MHVLLIEPYYGGSHRAWADAIKRYSRHEIALLTLPAQFWKWRMQGGAVTIARMIYEHQRTPDVLLVSSMINLATLRALLPDWNRSLPVALYLHETQLTYPQNRRQSHGWRYGFINYISALAADVVYFNSRYHRDVFFATLPNMLKHFGDYNELGSIDMIKSKAEVLSLGLDLRRYDAYRPSNLPNANQSPLILWNHRWEADKNPQAFFQALYGLMDDDIPFQVAIVGENLRQNPDEFLEARERLGDRVVAFGYLPNFEDYARLLWAADYVVSTAYQEFFGGAVTEAIYCGCVPVLPDRLNYPNLIPDDHHEACLYAGNGLRYQLRKHLDKTLTVDRSKLQAHVTRFDWHQRIRHYDDTLANLV
jgi:glycosyltransferase involved in cell wall biosynthesis